MIEQLFFELIRVAIGSQDTLSRPPSGEEWKLLYDMAKKQSLVGICFASVQRLNSLYPSLLSNLPEVDYLRWMGMAAKIQQRNVVVNRQCVELQKRLSADGFRSCILKGQGNLSNYGDLGMLRQSGDIDIWVEGGFEKINNYVQSKSPTNKINDHHIEYDCFVDTEVEVHYFPFWLNNPFQNKVLDRYFSSQEQKQFENIVTLPNDMKICEATTDFNIVFQLAHMYLHLFTTGIGMRQLMDYNFVLRTVSGGFTSTRSAQAQGFHDVSSVVSDLGLNRFASALMWLLGHVFGLEERCMPWNPNEKDGSFLLNEIMRSRNFGHHDERVPKNMTYWKSFWYLNFYNLRLIRFDYWSWFWTPIMRVKGFCWRKIKGYK